MANKISFERFQDFLDHNRAEILGNYFTYYHLIQSVKVLNEGKMELFAAYNVVDDDGSNMLWVWTTGHYFLYSNKWNEETLNLLSQEIEVSKYRNFNFLGRTELISALLDRQNIVGEILKDRIIYECPVVTNNLALNEEYSVENANYEDFDELVQMSLDNYTEEYSGEGQKGIEHMRAAVTNGIENNKLFLLRDSEEICSIVQVVNENQRLPMIGNLFTKQGKRNRGCAFHLLHVVTKGFLNNEAEKCGLVSDKTNPASNKVFLKVGYVPVYNWSIIFKE